MKGNAILSDFALCVAKRFVDVDVSWPIEHYHHVQSNAADNRLERDSF